MKHAIRTATAFALATLCLCSGADAKVITFEPPANAFGVWPVAMNDKGQVTGYVDDSRTGSVHGFLWQKAGGLTTFDFPATLITRDRVMTEVFPSGISADGVITGSYIGPLPGHEGFVRAADGAITTFSVGHQGSVGGYTSPNGANGKGWSAGAYMHYARHFGEQPFLRDPSGAIQKFTVPGASEAMPTVVNLSRAIAGLATVKAGTHVDKTQVYRPYVYQAFFRPPHGTAVLFGHPGFGAEVAGINDAGTVVGAFQDAHDPRYVAFIRTSDGTLTYFTAPNGAIDTHALGINNSGTIAGYFTDSSNVTHGFLRAADGTFTPFDIAGASWTRITAINDKGAITGSAWIDGTVYGFAGKP